MRTRRKTKRFSIVGGKKALKQEMPELPKENECLKIISDGGFSSICFILAVAEETVINHLYVSTFRVGKKEILVLKTLSDRGQLDMASFVFCGLMSKDKYPYFKILQEVCNTKGWRYEEKRNHSKVLLFDTDLGKFVLETSSNLNENPKIEQFSFERDSELFDFYLRNLFDIVGDEH